ncbi:MAG: peptide-binding protein, partial [Gammaproteobacteria bacterium]|nr:peptide-binding protein [Gammaproteobacteria bacterium]NIR95000.1 peptide-binding protein [Gammaproteobacteria bacterium]
MESVVKYFLLVLLFLIAACEQQQAPVSAEKAASEGPAYGDTFIEASIGEPSNLLPVLSSDSASSDINQQVYNGLIRYDKNLKLEGELAESWEISEDNLTITFYLRKGVKWHDGHPFTSADVMFTYQMYINPEVPTSYAEDFLQVAKAEIVDDYTFRVTYEEPYAPALESWGTPIHPKHLLEGQDVTKSPLSRSPIGTGPYKFVKWDAGEKVELLA